MVKRLTIEELLTGANDLKDLHHSIDLYMDSLADENERFVCKLIDNEDASKNQHFRGVNFTTVLWNCIDFLSENQ